MSRPPLSRILYIEDEPNIGAVAKVALEDVGGFTVELAGGGREGFLKAQTFLPDLILLYFMMPEMDGVTTFRALPHNPVTQKIPIISVTGKVQPKEVESYKQLGVAAVIPKPFDPMTVLVEIRAILESC